MAILGTLIKEGIRIRESLEQEYANPYDLQKIELRKLLLTAENTAFGSHFDFKEILSSFRSVSSHNFYQTFCKNVPIYDYNKIHDEWWYRNLQGEKDICWPGAVKYFALSSGTSEASSKHIPVTKDMIKAIRKTGQRHILSLSNYDLPDHLFSTGILMLGGSTHLHYNGTYFEGDLSGITASQIPFWFQRWYKPGQKIAKNREWSEKIDEITEKARDWNIGIIVGVPAWIEILLEKIIKRYGLKHIHEIWPDLMIYVHGGVSFEPYKRGFRRLLGKELIYIETYLASEGFIAFQTHPEPKSMRMVLNNGIFYEFIPFTAENFDQDGNLRGNPRTYMIDEIEENKDYALLLSSCAGAWRYLIGDTVRLVSRQDSQIIITGRTKHYLSLCGEHLSVENMNKAIQRVEDILDVDIKEFTVAGITEEGNFHHKWFLGSNDQIEVSECAKFLDLELRALNDDYGVERDHALGNPEIEVLPSNLFYEWMRKQGKEGGQNKFPRVMRPGQLTDWELFLSTQRVM